MIIFSIVYSIFVMVVSLLIFTYIINNQYKIRLIFSNIIEYIMKLIGKD